MSDTRPAEPRERWFQAILPANLPSWLLSVIVHALLLIILGLTMRVTPRGIAAERGREVAVVIKHLDEDGQDYYESEGTSQQATQDSATGRPSELVGEQSPVDIQEALPKGRELIGIGDPGKAAGAADMARGPRQPSGVAGYKARTKVYGIQAEGNKFVYVFDRSASMGGSGYSALRSAKTELLASLEQLGPTNQFQIIFYNQEPTIAPLAGGRLVFGNEQNKQRAKHFVEGIIADGGTDHEKALDLALNLSADVIFFLTDADQPEMGSSQLARIHRKNRGASIHTIEFGQGPSLGGENFLARLAHQNGGQYVYIDISRPVGQR
jgi:hypothetical protein